MSMTPEQEKRISSFRADARTHSFERLEGARDEVQEIDLPALADWYERYDDWDIRSNVLGLMQDYNTPEVRRVMENFLCAPPTNEFRRLHQAVALNILADHGSFETTVENLRMYQRDEERLLNDVQNKLGELGLETLPEFPKRDHAHPPGPPPEALSKCNSPGLSRTLLKAVEDGDLEAAKASLEAGASIHVYGEEKPYDGCTPLMIAVLNRSFALAEMLIQHGANVDQLRPKMFSPPHSGESALWMACDIGDESLVKLLLRQEPILDSRTTAGHTPLYRALLGGWGDIAKRLREAGAGVAGETHPHRRTFLNSLTVNGSANIMRLLLEFGASGEVYDDSGCTPLLLAAELGEAEKITVLLDGGANIEATHRGYDQNKHLLGMTPLAIAITFDRFDAVKTLIEAGANLQTGVDEALQHDGSVLPKRKLLELAKPGSPVERLLIQCSKTASS